VPLRQNAEEKAIRVYDKGRGKSCGCVCLIATGLKINLVYYESIKRKLKTGPGYVRGHGYQVIREKLHSSEY
jgi:hypothetical protein